MKNYIFIAFISSFIVTNAFAQEKHEKFSYGKVVFTEQDLAIAVEVAATRKQRSLGLMFRKNLGNDKGMLFIFEQEVIQRVWMKNTLIPLDIVFISAKGKVVSMIKDLQPCVKKSCDTYDSIEVSKYMLEINAGLIDSKKIRVGQKMLFFW